MDWDALANKRLPAQHTPKKPEEMVKTWEKMKADQQGDDEWAAFTTFQRNHSRAPGASISSQGSSGEGSFSKPASENQRSADTDLYDQRLQKALQLSRIFGSRKVDSEQLAELCSLKLTFTFPGMKSSRKSGGDMEALTQLQLLLENYKKMLSKCNLKVEEIIRLGKRTLRLNVFEEWWFRSDARTRAAIQGFQMQGKAFNFNKAMHTRSWFEIGFDNDLKICNLRVMQNIGQMVSSMHSAGADSTSRQDEAALRAVRHAAVEKLYTYDLSRGRAEEYRALLEELLDINCVEIRGELLANFGPEALIPPAGQTAGEELSNLEKGMYSRGKEPIIAAHVQHKRAFMEQVQSGKAEYDHSSRKANIIWEDQDACTVQTSFTVTLNAKEARAHFEKQHLAVDPTMSNTLPDKLKLDVKFDAALYFLPGKNTIKHCSILNQATTLDVLEQLGLLPEHRAGVRDALSPTDAGEGTFI